jgi:Domain of unknown function (DUF4349)
MRSFPLTLSTIITVSLALAACGKKAEESNSAAEVVAAGSKAGPTISAAVAPGVAFAYNYAFTLPGKAISKVQQQHAAACQTLGPSRCRITGMSYEQPQEDDVSARLDFLLAPDIAASFGNDAVAAVEKAEGKVDNASVRGENAGDAIKLSQSDSAAIEGELARLEARLAAKGLTAAERAELQQQAGSLREQLRGKAAERTSAEASIATTPVSFVYASESVLAGKGTFGKAAGASWSSAQGLLSLLLLFGGIALPWLGIAGLIVLGWRWLRKTRVKPAAAEPTPLG